MSVKPPIKLISLPLFPLHQVLFPSFHIHLHIFEERYKAMISACVDRGDPFGVVLIREGEEIGDPAIPCDVGCMARIIAVKILDEGRMHILASCEDRFRILDTMEADLPYLIGRVEKIEDYDASDSDLIPLTNEVGRIFQQYIALLAECVNEPIPDLELPADPTQLSHCVAFAAQISNTAKQRLLEMTSTKQRLLEEQALLQIMVIDMESRRMLPPDEEDIDPFPNELYQPINTSDETWQVFRHQSRN